MARDRADRGWGRAFGNTDGRARPRDRPAGLDLERCRSRPSTAPRHDHWSPRRWQITTPASVLDLIEYLATHMRDTPVVIVGLARPEFIDHRPGWGSGLFAHTTIGLDSLSTKDAATLAAHLLAKAAVRPETISRLVEASEGNPLFVEELTAALAEGHEPGADLPTTVRAAIASRLDALPSNA